MTPEHIAVGALVLFGLYSLIVWLLSRRAISEHGYGCGTVIHVPDEIGTCETCRFRGAPDPLGDCHRFPPTKHGVANYSTTSFPQVKRDDWCGEWGRR